MGVPLLLIGIGAGKFMPKPGGWMSNVSKVFGVVMLAIAIWMLEKFTQTNLKSLSSSDKLNFKVVKSLDELDNLLQKNRGKKIMLDFSAKWCTSCKEYDEVTFKDSRVMAQLSNNFY
jgi:thiol:disulfide interchange protein DsbD